MNRILTLVCIGTCLVPGAALAADNVSLADCERGVDGRLTVPMATVLKRLGKTPGDGVAMPQPGDVIKAGPCGLGAKCTNANYVFADVVSLLAKYDHGKTGAASDIELVWNGGDDPYDQDAPNAAAIEGFLSSKYTFVCIGTPPPKPAPPVTPPPGDNQGKSPFSDIVVAQDVTQAPVAAGKRKPALLSLKSDRIGHTDTYTFQGAVIWNDPLGLAKKSSPAEWWVPVSWPYLQLNEKTNKDPTKKTDDFTVGVEFQGRFLRPDTPLYLDASWITDLAHRTSSQYLLTARVAPPFDDICDVCAYGSYPGRVRDDHFTILPVWRFEAVADYSDVANAGSKVSLLKVPQFTRLGFNAHGAIRLGWGLKTSSVMLTTDYSYRNELSSRPANAALWDFGVEFKPSDTSNYSFSIGYQYGRTTDTLTPVKEWDASFGFKN